METSGSEKCLVTGLMSGTSLDGVDIVLCGFEKSNQGWNYEVIDAETIPYPVDWQKKLVEAETINAIEFIKLNREYGNFLGIKVKEFLKGRHTDLIASHGHTIFHQPDSGVTFQLGCGYSIAAQVKVPVVFDFRTSDVVLGGQGAPLVPAGDKLLFQKYDACLNLGGFSNISFNKNNQRIAFDISPANIALNYFTKFMNKDFDLNGSLGKSGKTIPYLLEKINAMDYYRQIPPKSLGKEWFVTEFLPLIPERNLEIKDVLNTLYHHISDQISYVINNNPIQNVLVSGGGAHNEFLMQLIIEKVKAEIIIPDNDIIDFKEAIIFAFLGLLRTRNEINILSSVTGARENSSGGVLVEI